MGLIRAAGLMAPFMAIARLVIASVCACVIIAALIFAVAAITFSTADDSPARRSNRAANWLRTLLRRQGYRLRAKQSHSMLL